MKRKTTVVALILVAALVLGGCEAAIEAWIDDFFADMQLGAATAYEDMEYVRPDMARFRQSLEKTTELAKTEDDVDVLMESIFSLYELYYSFSTNYNLAQIHYFQNMSDTYWEEEYNWCMEQSNEVSAGMDQFLYDLAACDLREELEKDEFFGENFFDDYDGDSLWDETFTALMDQETALLDRYYELSAQSLEVDYYSEAYFSGVGLELEELFVELIQVRQDIAAYAGYNSYPEFAYEFYFYRDYTPAQAQSYMDGIAKELAPLYTDLDYNVWGPAYESCGEEDVFAYVQELAQTAGGVAEDAFTFMEELGVYDLTAGPNKYDASFEVYLISYYTPFVFVNPQGTRADQLTFAHEFGHFCNDYAVGGTVVGIDVAEVFSQGLEYLSLTYCEDGEDFTKMKLADSLCVFVEQSVYATFENQAYLLENPTVEDVRGAYQRANEAFGLDIYARDYRDYTMVPHFFMSPMYVISYVVSNDGAMQIYERELAQKGAGLALWEEGLYSMESGYLGFVKEQKMEDPFAPGRMENLRKVFEEKLMK